MIVGSALGLGLPLFREDAIKTGRYLVASIVTKRILEMRDSELIQPFRLFQKPNSSPLCFGVVA
jgi:hypothetical protein